MTKFPARAVAVATMLLLSACGTTIAGSPSARNTAAPTATAPGSAEAADPGAADSTAPAPESVPSGDGTDEPSAPSGSIGDEGAAAGSSTDPQSRYQLPPEDVSTTWDVEVKDDAVVLDYDIVAAALRASDPAAGRWEFDSAAIETTGLAVGDALLVAGQGMGRVSSIDTSGRHTVIHTSEASLADIIENGTMAWDAAINFGEDWAVDAAPAGLRSPRLAGAFAVDANGQMLHALPRATGDGLTKWEFADGDTTYTFQVTPGAAQTDVIIQVSRNELTFTATGTVGAMRSMGTATFKNGKLATSKVDHDGLGGNLRLKMAAAGAGSGELKLDVPGLMFKYIVPVGPVPVTMGITAQVIGTVQVPVEASVVFESNFSYTGTAGFTYTGSEVNANGTLGNMVMDPKAADPVGFIGSTVDAQFGVSFPKVSLSIFEQGLVPSLQPAIFLGTTLTWGPVCKTAYIRSELLLGYDLKAFGVSFANGKETIWEKRRDTKGDSCE